MKRIERIPKLLWCGITAALLYLGTAITAAVADEPAAERAKQEQPAKRSADSAEPGIERHFGVTYLEREGTTLRADIYVPQGDGPFPGVLMIHGGAWMTGSRWNMMVHANTVARAGYTVVAIDYRLAPQYPYPAQLDDCRAALDWMRQQAAEYRIDADRIATYGYSAGGHLACLLGLQAQFRIQAIVAGGAPCDFLWLPEDSQSLVKVFGHTRGEAPDVYRAASPLTYASADDPPVFLYHGAADLLVPEATSRRLADRLQELEVHCELVIRPGLGHVGTFLEPAAPRRAVDFLDKVFKPQHD